MTDRFEETVRQAAQGLRGEQAELPSYHHAWQRGRRRRFIKRGAMAAAGVAVVAAALSVNLSIPGSQTTDVDEVAGPVAAATAAPAPTVVSTTAPVQTPPETAADNTGAAPTPLSGESTVVPTPNVATTVEAAVEPPPTTAPAPSETTAASPEPTVAPDVSSTPIPVSEPTPGPTLEPTPSTAFDPGGTTIAPDPTAVGDGTPEAIPEPSPTPTDSSDTGPAPEDEPQVAATSMREKSADAVVLDDAARGTGLPCDLDDDGTADASCDLMAPYACASEADAKPGYLVVDLDGDDVLDTCVAHDVTTCDTSGDGLGDTPCTIELIPAEPAE